MEILINIMQEILTELQEISSKLDVITGSGLYNSLSDVCNKLNDIAGKGLYNSLSDVCNKLDSVETTINLKD